MTDPDKSAVLASAVAIQAEIDALTEKQDLILAPLVSPLMSRIEHMDPDIDRTKIEAEISAFPAGFYRTELRTAMNLKISTYQSHRGMKP